MKYDEYMKMVGQRNAASFGMPSINQAESIPSMAQPSADSMRSSFSSPLSRLPPGFRFKNPIEYNERLKEQGNPKTWYNPETGEEKIIYPGQQTPKPPFVLLRPGAPKPQKPEKPVEYGEIINKIDGNLIEDVRRSIEGNPELTPVKIQGGWLMPGGILITDAVYNELIKLGVIYPKSGDTGWFMNPARRPL